MSSNKLTDTLDSLSDKAFGFKDNHPGSHPDTSETVPVADPEDKTETLNTAHAPTSVYPIADEPTETHQVKEYNSASDAAAQQDQPVCFKPLIKNQKSFDEIPTPSVDSLAVPPDSYPQPPINPPTQSEQGHNPELKTGPQQNFTVATVAGFMGILCLFLMFTHEALGLIAVGFGATAVYFSRKTERAGTDAGIGKTLGYISFFGGIIATIIEAFVLFIVFLFLALAR